MIERSGFIYLVRNMDNGKVYIGQTVVNILRRWQSGHVAEAKRGKKSKFAAAIRKYGRESFRVYEIAKASTRAELDCLEDALIRLHRADSPEFGYNVLAGGQPHPMDSQSARDAVGRANSARLITAEYRERLRQSHKNRPPVSAETSARISAALRGRKHSDEHKRKNSEARKRTFALNEALRKGCAILQ